MMKAANIFIFFIILSSMMMSCVPGGSGKSSRRTLKNIDDPSLETDSLNGVKKAPSNLTSSLTYINYKNTEFQNQFEILPTFSDVFYFTGNDLHNLADSSTQNHYLCLVVSFPSSNDKKQVLLSASKTPHLDSQGRYQFKIDATNKFYNESLCDGVINSSHFNSKYNSSLSAFNFESLCSGCSYNLNSSELVLYNLKGELVNISLNHLSIRLSSSANSGGTTSPNQCSISQCKSIGKDCCVDGQCVNNGSVKFGVNRQTQAFYDASLIIANDPSQIINYSQYFYYCPNSDTDVTPPTVPVDKEINKKEELFNCTISEDSSELATCTVEFDNASFNSSKEFEVPVDDISLYSIYSGSGSYSSSTIKEITYAGETLYKNGKDISTGKISVLNKNDNLSVGTKIKLNMDKPANAPNDKLRIKYTIDGSCVSVGTSSEIVKCKKTYIQGKNSNPGESTDHLGTGNSVNDFLVPYYIDLGSQVKVYVDGVSITSGSSTGRWIKTVSNGKPVIRFNGSSKQIQDGQLVEIHYYVKTKTWPVFYSKEQAIKNINQVCGCVGASQCLLKKEVNEEGTAKYECDFNPNDPDTEEKTREFSLSAKSAPLRYFNLEGTPRDIPLDSDEQEGNKFEYINNDYLKPNNINNHIGFNEIYGSIRSYPGSTRAPLVIPVTLNKTYDIEIDNGRFSNCPSCGSDYYSSLADIFPKNFSDSGGGLLVNPTRTNRFKGVVPVINPIRSDDLLFGRACFVPATMIPWTHKPKDDLQDQRLSRMNAQHFLFSNGYNRDWYGFDYGAIIGSFDGVSWFAIGSRRTIKAKGQKLYIAVNGYFSDLTDSDNFSVNIRHSSLSLNSDSTNSDYFNDGAECQRFHSCQVDSDCIGQLGYDYACEDVSQIRTNWPKFDYSGKELKGTSQNVQLTTILHGFKGGAKRCVYRAKGAACHLNYAGTSGNDSYSRSQSPTLNGCTIGNYCQSITSNGKPNKKFNNKIARFAKSPKTQNSSSKVDLPESDIFGLAARVLGRPFNYHGNEQINSKAYENLFSNNVKALCLPGRDVNQSSIAKSHVAIPPTPLNGDKVLGMGMTKTTLGSGSYFSQCGIVNSEGNYFNFKDKTSIYNDINLQSNRELVLQSASQVISTNSLYLFEGVNGIDLIKDFGTEPVDSYGYQANRCLKAPGASCFSDFECAPNEKIAGKINLFPNDGTVNEEELKYWSESLVCGGPEPKRNPSGGHNIGIDQNTGKITGYQSAKNRCCRETGKTLTIATNINSNPSANYFNDPEYNTLLPGIPGLEIPINEPKRYSRYSSAFEKIYNEKYPHLVTSPHDNCKYSLSQKRWVCTHTNQLPTRQWKTFDHIAKKTCCSENWVRNFKGTKGDHHFLPSKQQNFSKENFRCLNFIYKSNSADNSPDFKCKNNLNCNAYNMSEGEALKYIEFFTLFELLGVPQVKIPTNDAGHPFDFLCKVDPENSAMPATGLDVIPGTIRSLAEPEYLRDGAGNYVLNGNGQKQIISGKTVYNLAEYDLGGERRFYAADDVEPKDGKNGNFAPDKKQIFSKDEISCCIPGGQIISGDGPDADKQCCTGKAYQNRCCLEDYVNVSVYLNRYISSEGATYKGKPIPDEYFDPNSGYLDVAWVEKIAREKNLCCSGKIARGRVYSRQAIPGLENSNETITRFISSSLDNRDAAAGYFDQGLRWNSQWYCVPQNFQDLNEN